MTSRVFQVLICLCVIVSGGCRQPDGQVPAPGVEVQQELGDVVRDLQNVASARDPQAPKDLADDLRKCDHGPLLYRPSTS